MIQVFLCVAIDSKLFNNYCFVSVYSFKKLLNLTYNIFSHNINILNEQLKEIASHAKDIKTFLLSDY